MRRLKDKDLQKQLDELSGGSFSDGLAKGVIKLHDDSGIPLMKVEFGPFVGNSMTRRFALVFEEDDVEEYNPKGWNNYPDVTPPEGVLMRLEFDDGFLTGGRYDEKYKAWRDSKGLIFPEAFTVKRFRPWED